MAERTSARKYYPGMGSSERAEVHWLDNEDLEFGDDADVTFAWDGTSLNILPVLDDTGQVRIGNGTLDIDFRVTLGGAAAYVQFDVGNVRVDFEGVDLRINDNDILQFGDDADVSITWDGGSLNILPLTDNVGIIEIGNGTLDIDVQIFMNTAAQSVLFDVDASRVIFEGTDLRLNDTDILEFGDDADVAITWDGGSLNIVPLNDDVGVIEIGNGTDDIDLQIFLGAAGEFALFDVGNSRLTLNAIDFMVIATAAGNYLEYDADEERVNLIIAAKTPAGVDHALSLDITTTFDGGDEMVGLNIIMRPQNSTGVGTWLSGIYSAVVMAVDGVAGYFCAAELEIVLTGNHPICEYAVLVMNVNDSMTGGADVRSYFLFHDYGSVDMNLFMDIRDLAIGTTSATSMVTTSGDRAQDHAIRIRLPNGTYAWLMVTQTAP